MTLDDEDKQWITDILERLETKMLTAFHDWAQTYEVRSRGVTAKVMEFEERLGIIEERVSKLERGRTQ